MQEISWLIGKWKSETTQEANGTTATGEIVCSWWEVGQTLIECDHHIEGQFLYRKIFTYDFGSEKHTMSYFDANTGNTSNGELIKTGDDWNLLTYASLSFIEGKPTIITLDKYSLNEDGTYNIVRHLSGNGNPPIKQFNSKLTKID